MGDQKISLDSPITAAVSRPATQKPFVPVVDPNEANVLNRNKRMTLDELSQHYEKFTSLSGTTWDGSNKVLALSSNVAVTFSPVAKQLGQLLVKQDGTGSRTLTINGTSMAIQSTANSISVISAYYIDVLGGYVLFVGNASLFVAVTLDTTAPTIVSATATNSTTIRVVFSESVTPTAVGWSVFKQEISETTGPSSVSGSGTTWDFTVGGTAMTSSHTLFISYNATSGNTLDAAGNELASVSLLSVTNSIGSITPLSTPTLTATVISDTEIDLSWTNVANESSYKLEWSPNGTSGWTQIGGTIAANTTTYNHTGLTASTHYYYRITAVGDGVTYSDSGYGTDDATTNAGYDADALAFFTATGITDTTQKNAVNSLVTAFKTASVWTKMKAIYPCVGGTGTTHKYNLKDPRDLDAAYRLSYLSTTPHNANGIAFDGEGYCDTFFNTNGRSDLALGYYSHDNIDGLLVDMGSYDGTNVCDIKASIGGNATSTILSGGITWANANAVGLVVGSRLSSSDHKLYWNGVEKASESSQTGTFPNMTIYLGGRHVTGSVTLRTTRTCSFAFISDGLTGTEVTAVSTAIANFQTALGR